MPTRDPVLRPVMSRLPLATLACLVAAAWMAGCATTARLDAAAPAGVNLTGEWQFNPNLSDDPDKLGPDPDSTPQRAPGGHRSHGGGRGGGGGMPPMGSPGDSGGYNYLPVGLNSGAGDQPPPTIGGDKHSTPGRGASINRLLKAPLHMSITQKDANVVIKTNMPDGTQTVDEYRAGTSATIEFGPDQTADRSSGWRGPVFVVTTAVKKGPWREDEFALDDDGRLIVSTLTKGGRLGKLDIKRVYDRVRGAQS
jgi:hypothetical protein